MRLTINPVLDMESLTWISNEGVYDHFGRVTFFKGDPTAKAAEQSQANFNNELQTLFAAQYANQKANLDYLKSKLEPIISKPTGYSPQELAAMRTSATDTLSTEFQGARAALSEQEQAASGGSKLTGVAGATAEENAALLNSEALAKSTAQENITVENANLKQANYWNAISALSGVSGMLNPLGYAGAATSGSDAVANLGNTVNAANQSQLLGALGGAVGGAVGGWASGGFKMPCWVAASFWGWNDIRTWVVRTWMLTKAPKWFRNLYLTRGEWIASTPLRWAYFPIFKMVLING